MYNRQLATFLKVAECKSFTKAAELLYITPSAVVQQINSLENNLQAKLFTRTRHGLMLTDVGHYMLGIAREFISLDNTVRNKIQELTYHEENLVCVGASATHRANLFFDLWKWFQKDHSQYALHVKDLGIYITDWSDIDLIEGVITGEPWQNGSEFFELFCSPIGCVVSTEHPLSEALRLTYDDIRPYSIVALHPGTNPIMNEMLGDFEKNGLQVQIADDYNLSLFSRCELGEFILIVPRCGVIHFPRLRYVDSNWQYSVPYGFFYKKHARNPVLSFLDMAREFKEDGLIDFEELFENNVKPFSTKSK